jgi:pyruvate formate lyase activating enzyme
MLNAQKCVGCGKCADACLKGLHSFDGGHVFDRNNCVACGACAAICPTEALELCGYEASVEEILAKVKRDKVFYETSGGGVTVSGGEPLFQSEFTAEILRACKENGIHTAVETSGFADEKSLLAVMEYCDLFLFDIKESDSELHKRFTGVPLEPILNNLKLIDKKGIPFLIRAPIVPSYNDRTEHFEALKRLRLSMENCLGVQIMPYHRIGAHKYDDLDRKYGLAEIKEPPTETVEEWQSRV